MNGYVLGGYVVVLGSIAGYAASLVTRLRGAQQRAASHVRDAAVKASGEA